MPCYQDSVADEILYILDHAEVKLVVAENQEQVDKILEVIDRLPKVELIMYDDHRGLENYKNSKLLSLNNILEASIEKNRVTTITILNKLCSGLSTITSCAVEQF